MSDRYHSLTVVLDRDIRDDDTQPIIDAIKQIRNVLSVSGCVANLESHMAEERAKMLLREKLLHILS